MEVFTFKDRGGVGLSMYNTDEVNSCYFVTCIILFSLTTVSGLL